MIRWIAPFAVCASPALACPTAADLPAGIRATQSDGAYEIYQTADALTVNQTAVFAENERGLNTLIKGVYVARLSFEMDGVLELDSVLATTYSDGPRNLPIPTPSLKQQFQTSVASIDGVYSETQNHVWGPMQKVTIGDCTFDAITGRVTYNDGNNRFVETILYLPAVGIGLLTAYDVPDEPAEVFTYIRLEALK